MQSVFEQIRFDFRHGRLSHAVLLDGGSAAQRLEEARRITQMLVCSRSEQAPCGQCSQCLKAADGNHPDIFLYSGGTSVGSFKVDTVREIRRNATILPNEAAKKVFILEHAETMAAGAQNALLKILEEPPAYVNFILLCASHTQLLDTVLSRVSLYALRDDPEHLDAENTDQARQIAERILFAVAAHNEMDVMRETAAFEKDKELFRACCAQVASVAADALKAKLADVPVSDAASRLAMEMPRQTLYQLIRTANETVQYIAGNINGNLLLSWFSTQLCAAENGRT